MVGMAAMVVPMSLSMRFTVSVTMIVVGRLGTSRSQRGQARRRAQSRDEVPTFHPAHPPFADPAAHPHRSWAETAILPLRRWTAKPVCERCDRQPEKTRPSASRPAPPVLVSAMPGPAGWSIVPKGGHRLSEKTML
ncbi:hypothetical protein GCM10008965_05920 [Methylorubrum aminovorans]|nr:hypothetical protein GCM10025880_06460 [Methylorubrum aminovorans]